MKIGWVYFWMGANFINVIYSLFSGNWLIAAVSAAVTAYSWHAIRKLEKEE